MLRGILPGTPETYQYVSGVGTVAAGAPSIVGRFANVNTAVGNTAVVLPRANVGTWGFVSVNTATSARVFCTSTGNLIVAGVTYDNTTPFVLATLKGLLYFSSFDDVFIGVQIG